MNEKQKKPRRGNGEGSLFQRADGKWLGQITTESGKRRTVIGRTRKEADARLTQLKAKQADGTLPTVSNAVTVGQHMTSWLASARRSLRPSTADRYEQLIRTHIIPGIGSVSLAKLTPSRINSFYEDRLTVGHQAPASVRQTHAVLRKALDQAHKWNMIPRNPAAAVTPPKPGGKKLDVLTPDEYKAVLTSVVGHRHEALVVMALTTGMRQGELLALRWQDIDLERASVRVSGTLHLSHGTFTTAEPKTASGKRSIPLSQTAVASLRTHRQRQLEQRLKADVWLQPDAVFTTDAGQYIDGRRIREWFDPMMKRAVGRRIRFHDLRHSFATFMLAQGVHVKVLSELLGHATVSITLDVYSHYLPSMGEDAAARLDAALAT